MVDTVRTLAALQALLADNTSGEIDAQDVRDFLVSVFPPQFSGVEVRKSVNQGPLTASTENVLTWATETYDTDGYFNVGSSTTNIVIPAAGYYVLMAGVAGSGGATTGFVRVAVDGTPVATGDISTVSGFSPGGMVASAPQLLSAAAVITAICNPIGAAFTVQAGASTFFGVYRVGQAPA